MPRKLGSKMNVPSKAEVIAALNSLVGVNGRLDKDAIESAQTILARFPATYGLETRTSVRVTPTV